MNREYKMSITMLPEDVMLDIFDSIRIINSSELGSRSYAWGWERLAHVCRRWRQIVFASPLRLHIQLRCQRSAFRNAFRNAFRKAPIRAYLSCWPASFPIAIDFHDGLTRRVDEDNVIAALEHPNRVCLLVILTTPLHLEKLATVMREPFPALTKLQLSLGYSYSPVLLDGLLPVDGSPCLQELHLDAVSFKDLLKFIHEAPNLVTLHLSRMLEDHWLLPAGMALCLSALTKLRSLYFEFETNTYLPNQSTQAPAIRVVLPALTYIRFGHVCSYVEDLVSRIDCPRLNSIHLRYPHDSFVNLQHSQIFEFINRSEDPQLTLFSRVIVELVPSGLQFEFCHESHYPIFFWFEDYIWGALHLVQVFSQFSAKLSNVRHFSIDSHEKFEGLGISGTDWVHMLRSFTSLQTLFVSPGEVRCIALALDEERADELLPALDLLCLENGPANSGSKFREDRQRSGRPITLVRTKTKFRESLRTYIRE